MKEFTDGLNVGIDFLDANNVRVTSFQLMRRGYGVAIADYQDGKAGRRLKTDSVTDCQFSEFLSACETILKYTFPTRF